MGKLEGKILENKNNLDLQNNLNILGLSLSSLNLKEYIKIQVEEITSESLSHTLNNLLQSITSNIYFLKCNSSDINNYISYIQDNINSLIKINFWYLLHLISKNYSGEDLNNNPNYLKILETIKLIKQNLYFDDEEKFLKTNFNILDIENYIYNVVSNIEYDKKLSKTSIIENGYYINFKSKSYLGNTFSIEPIVINLIADLVHNSVKYSNKGTEIKISITQTLDNIIISVLDEGYGIKEENINKVFEHGVRLNNIGEQSGSGQGGSKCAYIVYKLLGEIYVRSEIGIGTEIKIILPN